MQSVNQNQHKKLHNAISTMSSECFKTPTMTKQQNRRVLEEDGIQCFDLENNSSMGGDNDLLRMSLMPGALSQMPSQNVSIDEQLKMWQELEKVKRENEHMGM